MNLNTITRRVQELVPGLTDCRAEATKDRAAMYFICTKDKMMRSVFVEAQTMQSLMFGMAAWIERSDEQIAQEIARGLA